MYIIAIAWIYVVSMMAITESSVTATILTILIYGIIPLGIVWFIAKRIKRRFTGSGPQKIPEQNSSKTVEKKETKDHV